MSQQGVRSPGSEIRAQGCPVHEKVRCGSQQDLITFLRKQKAPATATAMPANFTAGDGNSPASAGFTGVHGWGKGRERAITHGYQRKADQVARQFGILVFQV